MQLHSILHILFPLQFFRKLTEAIRKVDRAPLFLDSIKGSVSLVHLVSDPRSVVPRYRGHLLLPLLPFFYEAMQGLEWPALGGRKAGQGHGVILPPWLDVASTVAGNSPGNGGS